MARVGMEMCRIHECDYSFKEERDMEYPDLHHC